VSEYIKEDAIWAKDVLVCRQIVQKINEFGVNDNQRMKIIELIGLELERREDSVSIVETVKRLTESKESENNQKRIIT